MRQKPHFHQWSGWTSFSKDFITRHCVLNGCDINEDLEVKTGHMIRHHGAPAGGDQAGCFGWSECLCGPDGKLPSCPTHRVGGLC